MLTTKRKEFLLEKLLSIIEHSPRNSNQKIERLNKTDINDFIQSEDDFKFIINRTIIFNLFSVSAIKFIFESALENNILIPFDVVYIMSDTPADGEIDQDAINHIFYGRSLIQYIINHCKISQEQFINSYKILRPYSDILFKNNPKIDVNASNLLLSLCPNPEDTKKENFLKSRYQSLYNLQKYPIELIRKYPDAFNFVEIFKTKKKDLLYFLNNNLQDSLIGIVSQNSNNRLPFQTEADFLLIAQYADEDHTILPKFFNISAAIEKSISSLENKNNIKNIYNSLYYFNGFGFVDINDFRSLRNILTLLVNYSLERETIISILNFYTRVKNAHKISNLDGSTKYYKKLMGICKNDEIYERFKSSFVSSCGVGIPDEIFFKNFLNYKTRNK